MRTALPRPPSARPAELRVPAALKMAEGGGGAPPPSCSSSSSSSSLKGLREQMGERGRRGPGGGLGRPEGTERGAQRGLCAGPRPGSRSRPTGPRCPGAPAVRCAALRCGVLREPPVVRTSRRAELLGLQLPQRVVLAVRSGTPPKCRRRGQDVALRIRDATVLFVSSSFLSPLLCALAEGTPRCFGFVLPCSRARLFLRPQITVLCDVLGACAELYGAAARTASGASNYRR